MQTKKTLGEGVMEDFPEEVKLGFTCRDEWELKK